MNIYSEQSEVRDQYVEGIGPWHWPRGDTGAWGGSNDGPAYEFPQLLERILRSAKPAVILQAGGCCGMYPRLFAEHFERVFTFEPCPFNFYHLVQNCQKDTILKFQAALGDISGLVGLRRHSRTNVGMHTIQLLSESVIVPMITIDSLNMQELSVIQLDVEGSEEIALKGGQETIKKLRPYIVLETVSEWTKNFLEGLGYQVEATTVAANKFWKPE